jgi:hypothetical protein
VTDGRLNRAVRYLLLGAVFWGGVVFGYAAVFASFLLWLWCTR